MNQPSTRTCVIIVRADRVQPGFLDFSYRIDTLSRHYQVTLISNLPLDQWYPPRPGVHNIVIPEKPGYAGWLAFLWESARVTRQNGADLVVLLHSTVAPTVLFLPRIPCMVYWNEHPSHIAPAPATFSPVSSVVRSLVRWLMFEGARRATISMPIGEALHDDLLRHRCAPDRTRMIYMGVDSRFALPTPAPDGVTVSSRPLRLIYVGSIAIDRGRDVMLDAMRILQQRQDTRIHLTMIGAPPDQLTWCQDYIARHHLADCVQVIGRIPGGMIPAWFATADAGLCLWEDTPWYRRNPPTKLFEYLVAGLPVLASRIVTHTEYIIDGFNGLIFEYDSASLADTIQRLADSDHQLDEMKANARMSSHAFLWSNIEPVFLDAVAKAQT